jgi:hypothetical protein
MAIRGRKREPLKEWELALARMLYRECGWSRDRIGAEFGVSGNWLYCHYFQELNGTQDTRSRRLCRKELRQFDVADNAR